MRARAAAALAATALLLTAPAARASGPPLITESFITDVTASSANLHALINANGLASTYRFEYVTQAAFEVSGYASATKAPPSGAAFIGSGTSALAVAQHLGGLAPQTAYRYRTVATNSASTTTATEHVFATQASALSFSLPDDRGWELVSPPDKGGGQIARPGSLFGGGDLQAAAQGGAVTYGSSTSFGNASGAPPVSQYLSTRTGSGWVTENVSPPLASAAYGDVPDGAPYRVFSTDLSRGLLFGGLPCRGGIEGCPAPNPVIAGSGAPSGYMAYYTRGANGGFTSLLTGANLSHTSVSGEAFEVSFVAASSDLSHLVLSSCAALSANAEEQMSGPGQCDPKAQNLYRQSGGTLVALNLLPSASQTTPGAQVAAPLGAVSADGFRVYFIYEGRLYLREGSQTLWVDESAGGAGAFQIASADGGVAFFAKEGHLYRYEAQGAKVSDLTPAGGVKGVLGASEDGSTVYYQDAAGIERRRAGTTTQVAAGEGAALLSSYPPATSTARISADGQHLAFLSKAELTGYDNAGRAEAYLWGPPVGGGAPQLICASCNPTGERPQGPASIPATQLNGTTLAYWPRALSANGQRLFFDSADVLSFADTDNRPDVYQWEARGVGDCQRDPGCVSLLASGRSDDGSSFVDASADGTDAFFLTGESLVGADPGSVDLYDARAEGGFPEAPRPIPCIADACQALPPTPEDPDPGTLTKNSGNPPQGFLSPKEKKKKRHHKHKSKGKGHHHKNGKGKYHVPLKGKGR
jgi:hypothetical protein